MPNNKLDFIPVYIPRKAKNQKKYVTDCLDTNWISSRGQYIERFEEAICGIVGTKECVAVCNGTVALMLAYAALGLTSRDDVIVPSLTYCATISQLNWLGINPQLVDSDNRYQLDVAQLEKAITRSTKAVVVPQLYGDLPDMEQIKKICFSKGLLVIEDAAESLGCDGVAKHSDVATLSLFANKTICGGELGAVVTNDSSLAKELRLLKSQAHIGNFVHRGPGFNFRATNIHCAIGLAQCEEYEEIVKRKSEIASFYRKNLSDSIEKVIPRVRSTEWMPLFKLPQTIEYVKFMQEMYKRGVDTRPCFTPIHLMEGFSYSKMLPLTNCERIYKQGFNLPSYPDLTQQQLDYIVECANEVVEIVG